MPSARSSPHGDGVRRRARASRDWKRTEQKGRLVEAPPLGCMWCKARTTGWCPRQALPAENEAASQEREAEQQHRNGGKAGERHFSATLFGAQLTGFLNGSFRLVGAIEGAGLAGHAGITGRARGARGPSGVLRGGS